MLWAVCFIRFGVSKSSLLDLITTGEMSQEREVSDYYGLSYWRHNFCHVWTHIKSCIAFGSIQYLQADSCQTKRGHVPSCLVNQRAADWNSKICWIRDMISLIHLVLAPGSFRFAMTLILPSSSSSPSSNAWSNLHGARLSFIFFLTKIYLELAVLLQWRAYTTRCRCRPFC